MLIENTLFGVVDKVKVAIERFRTFEEQALKMNSEGYYLAFSGGKDSIVIHDLAVRSGVKFKAHFNVTTVDAPEVLRFIKKNYPDVKWNRPKITMWQLIRKKQMAPTRIARYCCEYLKERGGKDSFVITGVRWAESVKRSMRKMTEVCMTDKKKVFLHPIIDWSDKEVWEYIKENNLPYPSLYDEGFTRIGCIGCPMADKQRYKHFKRWPHFEKMYKKTFQKLIDFHQQKPNWGEKENYKNYKDLETMWKWWLEDNSPVDDEDQMCFKFE